MERRVVRSGLSSALAVAAVACAALARPALAQQPSAPEPPLRDELGGPRPVGWTEYVATPLLLVAPLLNDRLLGEVDSPRWQGPILFDAMLHNEARAGTEGQRRFAGNVSDLINAGLFAGTFLVDNVIVAWGVHGRLDVAWRMSVINAEMLGLSTLATQLAKRLSARERPYGQECDIDPDFVPQCERGQRFRSFFSGHTSTAGVHAGLMCAHHLNVPLYGSREADVAACGVSVTAMLLTGAMRLVSSNHWATDIVTGGAVGFSIGYWLTDWMYYSSPSPAEPGSGVRALPLLAPNALGLVVAGGL